VVFFGKENVLHSLDVNIWIELSFRHLYMQISFNGTNSKLMTDVSLKNQSEQ